MVATSGLITTTVNIYTDTFGSYVNQFIQWGEWLFYGCVVIMIVWLTLWKAFMSQSFQDAMPNFIQEFFVIAFFYTVMIHCEPWLGSILSTATQMGSNLAHEQVDPSSIISNGIAISNLLLAPVKNSGILSMGFGVVIVSLAYIVVLGSFLLIALDLALTLIATTFLISISGFMLAFAVFPFTRTVARNTLDAVIANSFKLLCLYAVIAAGNGVFAAIANIIPQGTLQSFDVYAWIVAASLLFALISKSLPGQVARIVSHVITEHRGGEAAAIASSAFKIAQFAAMPAAKIATVSAARLATLAGSTLANSAAHFNKAAQHPGSPLLKSMGSALSQTSRDLGQAMGGVLSDHFKQVSNKLQGGESSTKSIAGIAKRMHDQTRAVKSSYSSWSPPSNP